MDDPTGMSDWEKFQQLLDDPYEGDRLANSIRQGKRPEQIAYSTSVAVTSLVMAALAFAAVLIILSCDASPKGPSVPFIGARVLEVQQDSARWTQTERLWASVASCAQRRPRVELLEIRWWVADTIPRPLAEVIRAPFAHTDGLWILSTHDLILSSGRGMSDSVVTWHELAHAYFGTPLDDPNTADDESHPGNIFGVSGCAPIARGMGGAVEYPGR